MKYNTKFLMMLNAGQKLVSMEGPAPRHLWNPQVGLVLGSQATSLSLAASPTSLKAGTAAARLDLAVQFISNHLEAEGLQEASLTGFPHSVQPGWAAGRATAGGHAGVPLRQRRGWSLESLWSYPAQLAMATTEKEGWGWATSESK